MIVVSRPDYSAMHVVPRGPGRYDVIKGHIINAKPLSKEDAIKMQNETNAVTRLQNEIGAIKGQLSEIDAQERDGEASIADVALKAHRGDTKAEGRMRSWTQEKHDLGVRRFRLESAKRAVEAELVEARRAAALAEQQSRAEAAKPVAEALRKRGPVIDGALRTLVDNLRAIDKDLQELGRLTSVRISRDIIRVNVDRALRSVLADLDYLQLERVAPTHRRNFEELTSGWADAPENWSDAVLLGEAPPPPPSRSTPPQRPDVKPMEPTAATMPTRRARSIHDWPGAPLREKNLTG